MPMTAPTLTAVVEVRAALIAVEDDPMRASTAASLTAVTLSAPAAFTLEPVM